MNESQDNTLSEKWKKATNAKIEVEPDGDDRYSITVTIKSKTTYKIEITPQLREAIKKEIQTNNHINSEEDALKELTKKALSIPVIYNECFWHGDCKDVEIVIIGHNPKLPKTKELKKLLEYLHLNEVYQYWNGVCTNGNYTQPTEYLIKISEIFREHYFKDYIKYYGPASTTQKILLLDISPLREIPYYNEKKEFFPKKFPNIRKESVNIYSSKIASTSKPKEIWLIGGTVKYFFKIKNYSLDNNPCYLIDDPANKDAILRHEPFNYNSSQNKFPKITIRLFSMHFYRCIFPLLTLYIF